MINVTFVTFVCVCVCVCVWEGGGGGGWGLENERRCREFVGGSGAILPQKSLKARKCISTFSMRYFLSKSFRQFLYKVVAL